jgi:hypothetical protein
MSGFLSLCRTDADLLEKRLKSTPESPASSAMHLRTAPRLRLPHVAALATASLALAFGLSACENVAGYTAPALVRVIDASYIAPAVNFYVEGTELAYNYGEGDISEYGTLPTNSNAVVKVTAVNSSTALVTTNVTLTAKSVGNQFSIFLTDNGASPTSYTVTALQDQSTAAASGHSAFRFINQAPRTGAVDIYMVPSGTTLANTLPLYTDLAVGSTAGYISFSSQTVTMVIVPTGTITPKYTSSSLSLTGGEVRTVMIIDSQLTSDPPVSVVVADDVN